MGDQFMKDLERAVKASPKYDPKELAKRCVLFKAILEGDSARFSRMEGESAVDPLEEPKWKFKRSVRKEDSGYVTFTDDKGDLVKLSITDENGKVRRLVPKGSGYEILEDRPKPSGHATTKDERLAEAFYRALEETEKIEQEVLAARRRRKQQELLLALKRQRKDEELRAVPIPSVKEKETCILNERKRKRRLEDKAFAEEESEKEAMDKVDDAGGTMQDHSHQGGSGRSCIGL